jgi:hypothetical protein
MRGLLDDLATRWSRERAAHLRCRGPIGAKTDRRVKIIKLLRLGYAGLDSALVVVAGRHDREVILYMQHDRLSALEDLVRSCSNGGTLRVSYPDDVKEMLDK